MVIVAIPQTRSGRPQRIRRPAVNPQPKEQPTPAPTPEPTPEPTAEPTPVEEAQEADTLKINTNLVTVPIIATTIEGNYIPDLRQEEFSISENGEKQQVAFFATVSAPFHVVLLLDTSASTHEKLRSIQRAAVAFVEQLQGADRVKVISFDNEVRELSDFTNDRAVLREAIYKAASGRVPNSTTLLTLRSRRSAVLRAGRPLFFSAMELIGTAMRRPLRAHFMGSTKRA